MTIHMQKSPRFSGSKNLLERTGRSIYYECLCLMIEDKVMMRLCEHQSGENASEEIRKAVASGISFVDLFDLAYRVEKHLFNKWDLIGGVEFFPMEQYSCYATIHNGTAYGVPMNAGGTMGKGIYELSEPAEEFIGELRSIVMQDAHAILDQLTDIENLTNGAIETILRRLDAYGVEIDLAYDPETARGTIRFNFPDEHTRKIHVSDIDDDYIALMRKLHISIWGDEDDE